MYESLFPSFLITFREAFEAALIVAIIIAYLRKSGRQNLVKYSFYGTIAAISVSCLFGAIIFVVYGKLEGMEGQIFEGLAALTATLVLTYMIFWMTKHAQTIKAELEQKVELAVTRGQFFGIVTLVFIAVFREGLETVLFLTTSLTIDSAGTVIGLVFAISVLLGLSWVIMKSVYRLGVKRFFQVTSIILIIFAAGLIGYGVHELMEAGESAGINFGVLGQHAFDINPPMVNGTYPLLHEKGAVGSIFAALVGYTGNPEWLRVIVYFAYWLVMATYFIKNYKDKRKSEKN